MNSFLLRTEQCPICAREGKDRSRNNLAVYSDGHTFCYGGHGLLENGSVIKSFVNKELSCQITQHQVTLPTDCDTSYPDRAIRWIAKYELDRNDLLSHNVLWSESNQRLIFPIYDSEYGVIAWQGRWFGEGDKVKWFGRGNLSHCFNIMGSGSSIVLVEDVVSSIKLAKLTTTMPLYGSFISKDRWVRLRKLGFTNVSLFLDPDKRKESIQFSRMGQLYGFNVRNISADKDPKEISYTQLKEILA